MAIEKSHRLPFHSLAMIVFSICLPIIPKFTLLYEYIQWVFTCICQYIVSRYVIGIYSYVYIHIIIRSEVYKFSDLSGGHLFRAPFVEVSACLVFRQRTPTEPLVAPPAVTTEDQGLAEGGDCELRNQ